MTDGALSPGDAVALDLSGYELEAAACEADKVGRWFDKRGEVRINWNKLTIARGRSGHSTVRTDRLPGGFERKVAVRFDPYVRERPDDRWLVERVWVQDERERGPGGNGSYTPSDRVIGQSTWVRLRQGDKRLTFCLDPGYTMSFPRERVTIQRGAT